MGVALIHSDRATIEASPALWRALADGIDRRGEPLVPPVPDDVEWYEVREAGTAAGVAIVQRDHPRAGEATLLAVATAREHRGRSTAMKALLAAERRLAEEGCAPMLTRVPRTNGRGFYFMLRCGYTPLTGDRRPDDPGDTTWFARRGSVA
jgi:GNAT superfamily N-acetyltransferase